MTVKPIKAGKEWEVIFSEGNNWRIGVYKPKYRSADEIPELEQHTCPEAFLLLEGTIIMLHRSESGQIIGKQLQPMELVVFDEPHAGISPNLDGVAYVVENAKFETTYTDIGSGKVTRKVRVD